MKTGEKRKTEEHGDVPTNKLSKLDHTIPSEKEQHQEATYPFTSMIDFIECSICTEIFVNPQSLKCSHTFCKLCIAKWLKTKKECPMCRQIILRRPYANQLVEKMCTLYESSLSTEGMLLRNKHKEDLKKAEREECQIFMDAAKTASQQGTSFLDIKNQWTSKEKDIFRIGYDKYEDDVKMAYCALAGFTEQCIRDADNTLITIMLENFNLHVPEYPNRVPVIYDFEMARQILFDILLC